jgi:hypothetical protein
LYFVSALTSVVRAAAAIATVMAAASVLKPNFMVFLHLDDLIEPKVCDC